MVYLPEDYGKDTTKQYQVIYLLDAESFYLPVVGMVKGFSKMKDKADESTIVVGIISENRTKDFTPVASNCGRNGIANKEEPMAGGGAEMFYRFIEEELKPTIEKAYRTNTTDILIGHSYSGLFALYTMFYHTESFVKVIAIDPSLWWDCGTILDEIMIRVNDRDYVDKYLYLGFSTKKRYDRNDDIIGDLKQQLCEDILPKAIKLNYDYKNYPEENHGTVAIPGFYDGLKHIFGK